MNNILIANISKESGNTYTGAELDELVNSLDANARLIEENNRVIAENNKIIAQSYLQENSKVYRDNVEYQDQLASAASSKMIGAKDRILKSDYSSSKLTEKNKKPTDAQLKLAQEYGTIMGYVQSAGSWDKDAQEFTFIDAEGNKKTANIAMMKDTVATEKANLATIPDEKLRTGTSKKSFSSENSTISSNLSFTNCLLNPKTEPFKNIFSLAVNSSSNPSKYLLIKSSLFKIILSILILKCA